MPNIFYIADTHFGHENVIRFDNRPFSDVSEMEEIMVKNWNSKVTPEDTTYILGDFCWGNQKDAARIAERLNGKKILIRGNHDREMQGEARKSFQTIKEVHRIKDAGRSVIMCHYPMPFYKHDYDASTYMLYGHVHITYEHDLMEECRKLILQKDKRVLTSRNRCQFYNCWCGFYGYTPATLDEIVAYWSKVYEQAE